MKDEGDLESYRSARMLNSSLYFSDWIYIVVSLPSAWVWIGKEYDNYGYRFFLVAVSVLSICKQMDSVLLLIERSICCI